MRNYSYEQKLEVIKAYREELGSRALSAKFGIPETTIRVWCRNYEVFGEEILKGRKKQTSWSAETKLKVVREYLDRKMSPEEICRKYKISTRTILMRWVACYNSHKDFKDRKPCKGEIYMAKGRKATQKERIEIVAFCIEHGKDYGLTIETYNVSYQQIYSWVKKYEEKGINGLTDRRGKSKQESELSREDRLLQENKILQAKIKDQEMEIALLKKLQELRGGIGKRSTAREFIYSNTVFK